MKINMGTYYQLTGILHQCLLVSHGPYLCCWYCYCCWIKTFGGKISSQKCVLPVHTCLASVPACVTLSAFSLLLLDQKIFGENVYYCQLTGSVLPRCVLVSHWALWLCNRQSCDRGLAPVYCLLSNICSSFCVIHYFSFWHLSFDICYFIVYNQVALHLTPVSG